MMGNILSDGSIIGVLFLIIFFLIMAIFTKSDIPRFNNSKEFLFIAIVYFLFIIAFILIKD